MAIVVIGGCRQQSESGANAPTEQTVSVIAPVRRDVPRYLRVTGTLYGDEETTVAAKVAGRVIEVLKDMGDVAEPGEPLIRVDPTDYELALAERQRAFYESLAKIGLSELPSEEFDVASLPSVERARLQAENAKARYERSRVLFERDPPLISEQDFADLQTAWEVAASNLQVERLTAEAVLAEARTVQAQVNVADQRVKDTVHRAPHASKDATVEGESRHGSPAGLASSPRVYEVAARMVTVGDYVQIGAPLMRLVDSDPLKFRASVAERRLGSIKTGQPAVVRVEALTESFTGHVSRVSPAVNLETRSFAAEILVPNPQRFLKAGSFATAQIQIARESALLAPASSILTFAGVHKIVIVEDNKAREQRVELGERFEDMIEIRAGLRDSDLIVQRPSATLTTGMPVKIVSPPDQSAVQASRGDAAGSPATTNGAAR